MSPTERRLLIIQILDLVASLEDEPEGLPFGARRAAVLLHHGQTGQALAALAQSTSETVVHLAALVERYARARGDRKTTAAAGAAG